MISYLDSTKCCAVWLKLSLLKTSKLKHKSKNVHVIVIRNISYLLRSEYIIVDYNTLPHSSFVRVPANLWPPNSTDLSSFVQKNVSYLIETSVGPKPKQAANGGLQPCITYNPLGPYQPGLSPETNVSTGIEFSKNEGICITSIHCW